MNSSNSNRTKGSGRAPTERSRSPRAASSSPTRRIRSLPGSLSPYESPEDTRTRLELLLVCDVAAVQRQRSSSPARVSAGSPPENEAAQAHEDNEPTEADFMDAIFEAHSALQELERLQRTSEFVASDIAQHALGEMFNGSIVNTNGGVELTAQPRLGALSHVVDAYLSVATRGTLAPTVDSEAEVAAGLHSKLKQLAIYMISLDVRKKMDGRNAKAKARKGKVKAPSVVASEDALRKALEEAKQVAEEAKRVAEEAKRDAEKAKRDAEKANKVAEKAKETEYWRYQYDRRRLTEQKDVAEKATQDAEALAKEYNSISANAAMKLVNAKVAHEVASKEEREKLAKAESQLRKLMEEQPLKKEVMLALLPAAAPVPYRASRANSKKVLSVTDLTLHQADYERQVTVLRAARTLLNNDQAKIFQAIAKKPNTEELTLLQDSMKTVQLDIEGNIASVKNSLLWVVHYTRELHLCSKK